MLPRRTAPSAGSTCAAAARAPARPTCSTRATSVERVHAVVPHRRQRVRPGGRRRRDAACARRGDRLPGRRRPGAGRADRARRGDVRPRPRRRLRQPTRRGRSATRPTGPRCGDRRRAVRQGVVGAGTGAVAGGSSRAGSARPAPCSPTARRWRRSSWSTPSGRPSTPRPASCTPRGSASTASSPALTAPPEEDVRAARDRALTLPGRAPPRMPCCATTIGVIATDATLTKAQCAKVAGIGHDGMARAIRPVHTMFDGDTLFALATGARPAPGPPAAARAARRRRRLRHPGHRSRRAGGRDGADPGPAVAVLPRRVPVRLPAAATVPTKEGTRERPVHPAVAGRAAGRRRVGAGPAAGRHPVPVRRLAGRVGSGR